jgi:hypothetical protein
MANHGPVYGLDADLKAKQDSKYDSQIEGETRAWVEAVTGEKITDFHTDLKDGVTLCNLVNKIRPGLVKKINKQKTPFMMMENIGFFLKGCAALGVNKVDQFMTVDLYEAKNLGQVIHCIHALGRHVSNSSSYTGPLLGTSVELRRTLSRSNSTHSSGTFDLSGTKKPSSESISTETTPRTSVDVDQLRAKEQERELQVKLQREADEQAKREQEEQKKKMVEQQAKETQERVEREKQERDRAEKEAKEKKEREAREAQAAKEKEDKERATRELAEKQEADLKKAEVDRKKKQEENEKQQREAQAAIYQSQKDAALQEAKAREEESERRQREQAAKEASAQPPDAEPAQASYNVVITWPYETSASDKLYVAGTFSSWQKVEMTKKSGNNATLELNLAPGAYQYKFVVNDDWKCDPKQDTQQDGSGNVNNQVIVA